MAEVAESSVEGETYPGSKDSEGRIGEPRPRSVTDDEEQAEQSEEGTQAPSKGTRGRGSGFQEFEGVTPLEDETMEMLLQQNVGTYADAALRLGVSHEAVKKRMQRVYWRYKQAKRYANQIEEFQRKRRLHKKGVKVA